MRLTSLRCAALTAALLVPTAAVAQVSVAVDDSSLTPGETVTVTITNNSNTYYELPNPCTWLAIFQGTPNGTFIPQSTFCIQIPVPLPAGSSASITWDQIDGSTGAPVPPGRYWLRVNAADPATFTRHDTWACIEVQSANDPTLTVTGTTQIGTFDIIDVSAPLTPSIPYATFFSFSVRNPLTIPGFLDLCLEAPIFQLDVGALNAAGDAPPYPFGIPNDVSIIGTEYHLQTVLVDGVQLVTTNAKAHTVRP